MICDSRYDCLVMETEVETEVETVSLMATANQQNQEVHVILIAVFLDRKD